MEIFSPYIIAGLIAWLLAHTIKYTIATIKAKSIRQFQRFYMSGGMPSAHSAMISAVVVTIGLLEGFGSPVFALGAAIASIVMYDAVTVRRSSGEQGIALVKLFTEVKSKLIPPKVAEGHTVAEIAVGAILGSFLGLITASFFLV